MAERFHKAEKVGDDSYIVEFKDTKKNTSAQDVEIIVRAQSYSLSSLLAEKKRLDDEIARIQAEADALDDIIKEINKVK